VNNLPLTVWNKYLLPKSLCLSAQRIGGKDGGSHRCAKTKANLLVGFACCQGSADAMEADSD